MWDSYFRLWVAGPITFHDVSVGSHYPFKSPHFFKISLILVDLHLFLTHIFPVFVLCTPILAVFMLRASLLTPNFRSFYFSGSLKLLSLRGSGFGTQLAPKIGSLVETFLLPPSLSRVPELMIYNLRFIVFSPCASG